MGSRSSDSGRRRRPSPNWVIGISLGVLVGLISLATPVTHQSASSAILIKEGRLFAANCAQCHGTDGQSGTISQLAGMSAKDMFAKMKDQQTHNSIMGAHARGYTDDQLRAIAAYFASLVKK